MMTRERISARSLTTVLAFALLGASSDPAEGQQPSSSVEVTTAVVATGVEDREPTGTATSFPVSVGMVYFYTVLEGDFGERTIEHVWRRDGEEVARVPLTVRGPRWRTWSSKSVPADWTGSWEAQVLDADGSVLATAAFRVGG